MNVVKKAFFDECDKLNIQTTEFSTNLNKLNQQAPNEFGQMLPWYVGDL